MPVFKAKHVPKASRFIDAWVSAVASSQVWHAGPNTLVGLAKPADAANPFDHDAAIEALLPAYTQLLQELKELGVPEAQMHEPILATTDAAKLKAEFTSSYGALSKVGLPINLVRLLLSPTTTACISGQHLSSSNVRFCHRACHM